MLVCLWGTKIYEDMNKIKTQHINPPIPIRDFDWEAVRESYDIGGLIGYGKTEQQAIDNLIEQETDED